MTPVTLELPWPPSVNTYWRHTSIGGRPRVYVTREGEAFRRAVAQRVQLAGFPELANCRLSLDAIAHPPDRRRRDLDNVLKALQDALALARVYEDDEQIDDLHIARGVLWPRGGVVVTLTPLSAPMPKFEQPALLDA